MQCHARPSPHDQAGFTLIEVVVALFLLGIVAAAGLTFFFRGMQNTSHLQRSQTAVAVANEAMEKVRSVTPRITDTATSTSGLLIGRTQTAVQAAWATAAAADTAQSNAVWDTAGASRPKIALPVVDTVRVSDQTYTITTLIGTCYRLKAASVSDQTCVQTNPGATAAQLYRVTVVVSWKPGKTGQCTAGACTYRVSTLIDPTTDANWNLTAKPVAYDEETTMVTGGAADTIDTLANDVYGFVAPGVNPTTITVNPTIGTASPVTSGTEIGRIRYTPPAAQSGITSLKYRLKDGAGRTSNEATLVVKVRPSAVNGSASVETSSTTSIPLPVSGTGLSVVASSGTVSGTNLLYTSGPTAGTDSVTFTATDSSGLVSDTKTLTISIVVPSPPTPPNMIAASVQASAGNDSQDLMILDTLGLTPKSSYSVTPVAGTLVTKAGSATPGTVVQSAAKTELNWVYSASGQYKQIGVYEQKYTVAKGGSAQSAQKTVTISVRPRATSYTESGTVAAGASSTLTMPLTNAPSTAAGWTGLTYEFASQPLCSLGAGATTTAAASASNSATAGSTPTFKAPTWTNGSTTGSCSFTYVIRWVQSGYNLVSDPATVTLNVTR